MVKSELKNTKGLMIFLEEMGRIKNSREILEEIFKLHFSHDTKSTLLANLNEHISSVFKIDAFLLLNFLASDQEKHLNSKYQLLPLMTEDLDFIYQLKFKYGFILNQLLNRSRSPFSISSADVNVETGSSTHKLNLRRADEKEFTATFTPGSILPILTLLNDATLEAIEKGIYNIKDEDLIRFIKSSDDLNSFIKFILLEHNEIKNKEKDKDEEEYNF